MSIGRPNTTAPARAVPTLSRRLRWWPLPAGLLACVLALASCGDTLQDQPIGPSLLENVIVKSRFPVYWLGFKFSGMRITGVVIDPSGAVTLRYGDCLVGGQFTCVTPLKVVSSPDNSFVPGEPEIGQAVGLRGVQALASQRGDTLALCTGSVVVTVVANRAGLAQHAARVMTPVNKVGLPLQPLPGAAADTGFNAVPLPSQLPVGATVPQPHGSS